MVQKMERRRKKMGERERTTYRTSTPQVAKNTGVTTGKTQLKTYF